MEIKAGHNVIGTISYTYDDMFVGSADIIYENTNSPTLVHTLTDRKPAPQQAAKSTNPESSSGYFRPIIIGIIVGVFVLIVGLYFVLVERPRLKRRNAYYKKRANRKRDFSDETFLDL